ncbi:MAG: PAS domain S-box-containing protein, partial [Kiritimatiellia bacterium]
MLNAKRSFSKVSEQLQTLARLAVDGETSALLDHVSAMTGARAAFWVHDERCWGGGPSLGRARPRAVEAGWLLDDAVLREHRSGAGSGVLLLLGELEDAEQILPIVVSWLDAHGVLLAQTLQREEATQRYDMLLDVTFEGLAVHRGGVLIEVNEALAQLYGYTREQMLGMRVADTIAPEAVDHVSRRIKSGFDGYYETVALRKDGSHVPLEARGRACIFDGREARVASFRDLRDRMRAEAALEQARAAAVRESQLKTVFLGNISHEVRTPMTAILGLVDIMLGSGLSPEQGHMMERLRGSAHGLIDLLDQVLDVTRIEEGRASVHLASFDLRATIVDSAASARRVREGVDLQFSIDPGIEDLWLSDASRVRQVLINLLDNASKYTESGHVALRVTRWSEGLVFEVEDSGRGLSQDELSSVFDRFVRGQRDVDVGSGAGLGLHITRQVVALLGGRLSVMSEEGVGSTFSVHLPMVQASPMPVEVLHGRRVLLLDGCSVMDEVERHLIYLGATCVRDVSEVWDSGFSC